MKKLYKIFILNFLLLGALVSTGYSANGNTVRAYMGKKDAPVTIYEFVSLSCSHCANQNQNISEELKSKYINSGKVKLIFMDTPLAGEIDIYAHSMLYYTANNEKFFALANTFFKSQRNWLLAENPFKAVDNYAALAGISGSDIERAKKDSKLHNWILDEASKNRKLYDIKGTPTMIIEKSNKPISKNSIKLEGETEFPIVSAKIDSLLNN